jgi:hypothetical protein
VSARDAGRYLAREALTLGWYSLAVVGVSGWDRNPDSWFLITFRIGAAALFLWAAVTRTIRHYHEDHPGKGGDE